MSDNKHAAAYYYGARDESSTSSYDDTLSGNPAEIERRILDAMNRVSRGVAIVRDAELEYKRATHRYDYEFARAYLAAGGAAHARKYVAEIETREVRSDADLAEVKFKHAQRQMSAAERDVSALQSLFKAALTLYSAAGHERG